MASPSQSMQAPPLSGTIVDIVSPEVEMQARKGVEMVAAKAAVTNAAVRAKAVVTDNALMQVAGLSALESHLVSVAPNGAHRYKHIADAFAISAASLVIGM